MPVKTTRQQRQSGQAIVIVALMLIVLFGFLGLAIDGGREYVQRREVQDGVDAASLGAGDNYLNTRDVAAAEEAAADAFAENLRIPGSGPAAAYTALGSDQTDVTWAGWSGRLTLKVTHNAFNGTDFQASATTSLPLAFMQVLGQGPNVNIAATATSVVFGQTQTPALLTLSQDPCYGTGYSLSIQGNANVAVVGALYSNGGIQANSGATSISVAGNAFSQCGIIPSQIQIVCYNPNTNPPSSDGPPAAGVCPNSYDVLGHYYQLSPPLPDPGYTAPSLTGLSTQTTPGTNVELSPGNYAASVLMPASSGCYFLQPGVYEWSGGFTANGGLYSNELRPPDEPAFSGTTLQQTNRGTNFWRGTGTNIVNCDGSFWAASVQDSAHPLLPNTSAWGVVVTAVRTSDNGYTRESAPSMCRSVNPGGTARGIQVAVSNVPGAQQYNVYANPNGCNQSTYGFIGSIQNVNASGETNTTTAGCPYLPNQPSNGGPPLAPTSATTFNATCSLGYEISQVFDSLTMGLGNNPFSVSSGFCSTTTANNPSIGCAYPDLAPANSAPGMNDGSFQPPQASGLPDQTPLMDVPANGGGDRANEYECRDQGATASTSNPCQNTDITPGAVQFYFPASQCLAVQGSAGSTFGDLFIFGGRQYSGIVIYAPAANTCSLMKLAGGSTTTIIGTIYTPGASWTIKGNSNTAVSGQVIVNQASIDGTSGTAITYNPALAPPPPGARLIQ